MFKMAASMGKRILVHARRANESVPVPLRFNQSVLDYFGAVTDEFELNASLVNDRLLLTDESPLVKIKRPSFCPVHHLTDEQSTQISEDILQRGVDVGAVTLLETCDSKVLLTRRAAHLRTFPGVWVPPGGHLESGETFFDAGCRELQEETGLTLTPDMCEQGQISILALWESVFPPLLSLGLPKRHHVVVYLHAKLKEPYTSEKLQQQINLDPDEVGACAWLDKEILSAIVAMSEEHKSTSSQHGIPKHFQATVITPDTKPELHNLETSVLLNTAPPSGSDIERVSTGTKFGLSEWLKKQT